MKITEFIDNEMRDLAIPKNSEAFRLIRENAIEAAAIMTRKELKRYIEEYSDLLPMDYFQHSVTAKDNFSCMGDTTGGV